jgi:hypothetical protein
MQREDILAAMKRTAEDNGGQPLGTARFERITGIGESDWVRYWSRFGDLQREAGYEPNKLNAAYDEAVLSEALISLIRELRRFPTFREMRTKSYSQPDFPSDTVFRRRGNRRQLITKIMTYCSDKPEYADVTRLLEPLAEVKSSDDAGHINPGDEKPGYGFVYLVKGRPGEYKIGRTKFLDRRMSELGAMAPTEQKLDHKIETDDPSGIEAYWHRRFRERHMRGEWFRLSAADVKAFKRWRRIY